MKKFKERLGKGHSSHLSMVEWSKTDEKIVEYTINGDENKLRLALLRKGVSPIKKRSDGKTVLDVACECGNVHCLQVLLEKCEDIISVSKAGCSALHTAAKSGHPSCIVKLLQYKVRVGSQDVDKMTALHHAASHGHLDCVKVLVSNGTKLNIREKDGRTALLIAIQAAKEIIVRFLLENGARVNLTDCVHKTPLMYACLIGLKDAVSALLQHGANPLLQDTNGHKAVDFARISGYGDIVKMIQNTPEMPSWSYDEAYDDESEEWPSQDGSVLGSNEGSEVGSLLSHPGSEQGFSVNQYPSSIRTSSHSLSTSTSSHPSSRNDQSCSAVQRKEKGSDGINAEEVTGKTSIDLPVMNEKSYDMEALGNEIANLRIENERLKNEKNDVNVDDSIPTIPITVYQQLKATTEEEVMILRENVQILNKENDILKRDMNELKRQTQDEFRNKTEQKIVALEEQVHRLQTQLLEADTEHAKTINVYRLHLLNAVQGDLDDDVMKALQLIFKLRSTEQFC